MIEINTVFRLTVWRQLNIKIENYLHIQRNKRGIFCRNRMALEGVARSRLIFKQYMSVNQGVLNAQVMIIQRENFFSSAKGMGRGEKKSTMNN